LQGLRHAPQTHRWSPWSQGQSPSEWQTDSCQAQRPDEQNWFAGQSQEVAQITPHVPPAHGRLIANCSHEQSSSKVQAGLSGTQKLARQR